jgi:hypothetical protein
MLPFAIPAFSTILLKEADSKEFFANSSSAVFTICRLFSSGRLKNVCFGINFGSFDVTIRSHNIPMIQKCQPIQKQQAMGSFAAVTEQNELPRKNSENGTAHGCFLHRPSAASNY